MISYGTPTDMLYDTNGEQVVWNVYDGNKRIQCRISREALEDNWKTEETGDDPLDIAQKQFDPLTDKIGQFIALGRLEEDGSVLLRTADGK